MGVKRLVTENLNRFGKRFEGHGIIIDKENARHTASRKTCS
jgi:hypothetical protein